MFSFASKMLNTIMGTEEGGPGAMGGGLLGQQPTQQQPMARAPGGGPGGMGGFPRPTAQPGMGVGMQRPYGGVPTFSGPRPSPAPLRGPPLFGGSARGPTAVGAPHRFSGPQPAPPSQQQQPPRGPGTFQPQQMRAPGAQQQPIRQPQQMMPSMSRQRTPQPQTYLQPQLDQPPDLSHLSAEERAMIENVMAKAQQLEQDVPPPMMHHQQPPLHQQQPQQQHHHLQQQQQPQAMRPKDSGRFTDNICPLCHTRDVREGGNECSVCRAMVCTRCGAPAMHPETKRPEWTCTNCIKARRMGGGGPGAAMGPGRQQQQPQTQSQVPSMDWEDGRRGVGPGQAQGRGWGMQDESEYKSEEQEYPTTQASQYDTSGYNGRGTATEFEAPAAVAVTTTAGTSVTVSMEQPREERPSTLQQQGARQMQTETYTSRPAQAYGFSQESHILSPLTPPEQLTPSMSTPVSTPSSTTFAHATSSAFAKTFVHSRSLSLEEEDQQQHYSYTARTLSPPPAEQTYTQQPAPSTSYSVQHQPAPSTSYGVQQQPALSTSYGVQQPGPSTLYSVQQQQQSAPAPPTRHSPSAEEKKAQALMEEFNKLQSAMEDFSTKRLTDKPRSPSPSPEEIQSLASSSPLPSPISLIQSPPDGMTGPFASTSTAVTVRHSKYPEQRKSIVMTELDDYPSSTEESESDDEMPGKSGEYGLGGAQSAMAGDDLAGLYEHTPGEVYTIPEEEDEGGSPTGADLVTSLKRTKQHRTKTKGASHSQSHPHHHPPQPSTALGVSAGGGILMHGDAQHHNNAIRPQLRPQRSLDNRLPSQPMHAQQQQRMPMDHHQQQQHMLDTQGNLAYAPNNNTQQQQLAQQQQQYTQQAHMQPPQQHPGAEFHSISPQPQTLQQQQQTQRNVDNINEWNNQNQMRQSQYAVPTSMDPAYGMQQQPPGQPQVPQMPVLGPLDPNIPPQQQTQQPPLPQYSQPDPLHAPPAVSGPFAPGAQQQPPPSALGPTASGQYFQQPASAPPTAPSHQQQQQIQQQQMMAQQLLQNQQQLEAQQQAQQQATQLGPWDIRSTSPFPPDPHSAQAQQQYLSTGQQQQGTAIDPHLAPGSQPGAPGQPNKSISSLISDFSRALGLGASPRPSPTDDKLDMFMRSQQAQGMAQPRSPYEQFLQPIPQYGTTLEQQHQLQAGVPQPPMQQQLAQPQPTLLQPTQPSAFAVREDPTQHLQQQQLLQQQKSLLQQFPYSSQPSGLPGVDLGAGALLGQTAAQQQAAQLGMAGMALGAQQQSLGVGVIGGMSPSQAFMYQQQMALQHQQQHLKKSNRRAHFPSGSTDIRRDLIASSALLIPSSATGGMSLTPNVLMQPLAVTPLGATTPVLTPVGTPRSGRELAGLAYDSSDTMSETDSQKSLRMRRKLPCLPPDQEAAPLPSSKKRERQRVHEAFRSMSPSYRIDERSFGLGGLTRPSASESNLRKIAVEPVPRPGSALGLLQGSSILSTVPPPHFSQQQGSMLGTSAQFPLSASLFSQPSLLSSMRLRTTTSGLTHPTELTTTTSVLSGLYPSYKTWDSWSTNMEELAACLPPDLRHLLNRGSGPGGYSQMTESEFPNYINTLREQLQEERRQLLADERKRLEALRERDRELGSRLSSLTASRDSSCRSELARNVSGLSRSAGASPILSRKLNHHGGVGGQGGVHRRQLSDPKAGGFMPFSPIRETADGDHALSLAAMEAGIGSDPHRGAAAFLSLRDHRHHAATLPAYKSYEYESLASGTNGSSLLPPMLGEWDRSQSYLAPSFASAGGILRETAISSLAGGGSGGGVGGSASEEEMGLWGSPFWSARRRRSDGEMWLSSASALGAASSVTSATMPRSLGSKRHSLRKHRKSRSWHPSPLMSEDDEEEDLLSREEKKAKIKAEIARRRQALYKSSASLDYDGEQRQHSVLKSVDQLLRDQYEWEAARSLHYKQPQRHQPPHAQYGGGAAGYYITSPTASEEDKSIDRIASTFRSGGTRVGGLGLSSGLISDYDQRYAGWNEDLASMDTDSLVSELGATPSAMPLLPDMPTRSRRLLEDLGSAPLGGGVPSGRVGMGSKGPRRHVASASAPIPATPVQAIPRVGALRAASFEDHDRHESVMTTSSDEQPDAMLPSSTRPERPRPAPSAPPLPPDFYSEPDLPSPSVVEVLADNQEPLLPVVEPPSGPRHYSHSTVRVTVSRDPAMYGSSYEYGFRIVGGKEVPNTGGQLGAYIAKLSPTFVERQEREHEGDSSLTLLQLGDMVLEVNGIPMENKTFEDAQCILEAIETEMLQLLLRSNFNIHTGKARVGCLTNDSSNESNPPNLDDEEEARAVGSRRPSDEHRLSTGRGGSAAGLMLATAVSTVPEIRRSPSSSTVTTNEDSPRTRPQAQKKEQPVPLRRESISVPARAITLQPLNQTNGHGAAASAAANVIVVEDVKATPKKQAKKRGSIVSLGNLGSLYGSTGSLSQGSNGGGGGGGILRVMRRRVQRKPSNRGGQIQLQICHDPKVAILYVTVLKAKLPAVPPPDVVAAQADAHAHSPHLHGHGHCHGHSPGLDPYVLVSLMPPKTIQNQRRTRHIPNTSVPVWNQTMVYPNISSMELTTKTLEVSAWHFTAQNANNGADICLGTVTLQLSDVGVIDERPHLYRLVKPPDAAAAAAADGTTGATGGGSGVMSPE